MGNYDFWWFDVVWVYYFYVERECCKFCFSSVDVDSEFIYCVDVCCCIYVINVKWYSWLKWIWKLIKKWRCILNMGCLYMYKKNVFNGMIYYLFNRCYFILNVLK